MKTIRIVRDQPQVLAAPRRGPYNAWIVAGRPGNDGGTGPANELSIGTVTGGPEAGATITGEAPEQVLNLTLPKGDTGPASTVPGPPGEVSLAQLNAGLAGKSNTGHTHVAADIPGSSGVPSATTYLAGDNTWKTPTNTTYSALSLAEFTAATATTARAVSALLLNQQMNQKITGASGTAPTAIGQNIAKAADAAAVLALLSLTKNVANGVAGLDASGQVAAAQLPSYVDDVLEYANLAAFPVTGETGKIYVSVATNKQYRWSGSAYQEINPAPGSTDSLTEGSVNLYYTQARADARAAAALAARTLTAGTGLTGGGTLAANRTFAVSYGSTAGTAAQGNDARLTDTRTPTDDTVTTAKIVDDAVTIAKVSPSIETSLGKADTAVQPAALAAAQLVAVNTQNTGGYTLVLSDQGKAIEFNSGGSPLEVPPNSTTPFPIGTVIEVLQVGVGKVTVVAGSGVTLNGFSFKTRAQWSTIVLRKRAIDTWIVSGDLE